MRTSGDDDLLQQQQPLGQVLSHQSTFEQALKVEDSKLAHTSSSSVDAAVLERTRVAVLRFDTIDQAVFNVHTLRLRGVQTLAKSLHLRCSVHDSVESWVRAVFTRLRPDLAATAASSSSADPPTSPSASYSSSSPLLVLSSSSSSRALSSPVSSETVSSLASETANVERQIGEIECKIESVEREIDAVTAELSKDPSKSRAKYLETKELQLRTKEEQLRTEKEQLRTKGQQLRTQILQPLAPPVQLQPSVPIADLVTQFLAAHPDHRYEPCRDTVHMIPGFIGRSHAVCALLKSSQNQLSCLFRDSDCASLKATSGAPGAGKTRFLDQLLHKGELYSYAQTYVPEVAALFHPSNVLVINISFSSKTKKQSIEVDSEKMVTARLLFLYFGPELLDLEPRAKFSKEFLPQLYSIESFHNLSVAECLKMILRHFSSTQPEECRMDSKTPGICIIGVDELMKAQTVKDIISESERKFLNDFIIDIGSWMDGWLLVDDRQYAILPVITSLSQLLVGKVTPNSSRSIAWLPLPSLAGVSEQVCAKLEVTTPAGKRAITILCRYLGEHGRLIELLINLLLENRDALERGASAVPEIIALLGNDHAARKYCLNEDFSSMGIISCAIRGDQLKLSEKPALCDLTVDELILNGTFISKVTIFESPQDADDTVQPILSLFQVYMWAKAQLRSQEDPSKLQLARAIHYLVEPRQDCSASSFERFHMTFEYLGRATDPFSRHPEQMNALFNRSLPDKYRGLKLAGGKVEFQELGSRIDLREWSTYPDGDLSDAPQHHSRTHVHWQLQGLSRESAVMPTPKVSESFPRGSGAVSVVSLAAPLQSLFDGMSDSILYLGRQRFFVRKLTDVKFYTGTNENLPDTNENLPPWVNDRVLPFAAGVTDKGANVLHRFCFISTGRIPEAHKQAALELCKSRDVYLSIFDDDNLPALYGPTLINHRGLLHLKYIREANVVEETSLSSASTPSSTLVESLREEPAPKKSKHRSSASSKAAESPSALAFECYCQVPDFNGI